MSAENKYLRDYPKGPSFDEIDKNDFVQRAKARDHWVRERAISLQEVIILRDRVRSCVQNEEVNHPQRCREHVAAYMKAYQKYRSEGWYRFHDSTS